MTLDAARPAPFSWVLLAGLGLAALPPAPAQPALAQALRTMRRRHPNVFSRLEDLGEAEFLVDPVDLPVHFRLRPAGHAPALTLHRGPPAPGWTAALRAPIATLLALLQGRCDGDAAFFGRDLVVEGDMAAALTLRNALDNAEVRLPDDLLAALGPLARPAASAAARLVPAAARLGGLADALRASLLAPAEERLRALEAEVERLRQAPPDRRRHGREAA